MRGTLMDLFRQKKSTTLIGASRTGKSSYLLSCWAQDELDGTARVLIDPSGSLAKEVRTHLAKAKK